MIYSKIGLKDTVIKLT